MIMNELEKSFKVLKILGQGSYGRVYLCKTLRPRREMSELVAIKRIECEGVEQVNEFLKELVEIRDLEHENIVKYHDGFIDRVEEKFFVNIVMEYLPGFQICDILEYFEKKNQNQTTNQLPAIISERFIINILSHMIDALDVIHRKNIIHRDISTNNIMVFVKREVVDRSFEVSKPLSSFNYKKEESDNDDGKSPPPQTPKLGYSIPELAELPSSKIQFKLLDFGFVTRKLTQQSLVDSFSVGTPDFQSPEILTRRSYNELTDIWSLGGVLLNFALGKQAHVYATLTSEKPSSLTSSMNQEHPLYIHLLENRGYSSKFLDILFSMLEMEPAKRIKTSDLKKRVDSELLHLVKEKEEQILEKTRLDEEMRVIWKNEKVRNIPIFKSQTIVSVNMSTNLSLWDWREHKKFSSSSKHQNQSSTVMLCNAHSWTISDVMSLSPGQFVNKKLEMEMEKLLLVSGGSKINLIRIDGQKMFGNSNTNNNKEEEEEINDDDKFYEIVKSFKCESKIEVLCPIFRQQNEECANIFSSGTSNSTIEMWNRNDEEQQKSTKFRGHQDSVITLCSFDDGLRLASGSKDRTVRIWDLEKRNKTSLLLIKDTKYITGLQFYEKKSLLTLANSYGMSIKFYDLRKDNTGSSPALMVKNLRLGSIALTQHVTGFQFVAENYICVGDNLRLNCYDIRYLRETEDDEHKDEMNKCWVKKIPVNDIMSLEGNLFATCSREGLISVLDVNNGNTLSTMVENVGGFFESRSCICRL